MQTATVEGPRQVVRARERLTRPESIPPRGSRRTLRGQVAEIALSATSAEDVVPALDEAFESSAFSQLLDEPPSSAALAGSEQHALAPSFDMLTARERMFGASAARKLALADRLWFRTAQRIAAKMTNEGSGQGALTASSSQAVLHCVRSELFPLEWRQLSLEVWRGLIANSALLALLLRGETHPLAEVYADVTLRGAQAAQRWAGLSNPEIEQMRETQSARERWVQQKLDRVSEEDGDTRAQPS